MTFNDFANKYVGKVYSFRSFDCEHLVIDGLKSIYDISVNKLTDEHFVECQKTDALFFACEDSGGTQCHVGLYNKNNYLHAVGNPSKEGQVLLTSASVFNLVFMKQYSKVRFYKWRW